MRRRRALYFAAVMLVLLPLFGTLGFTAGAQTNGEHGVAGPLPEAPPSGAAWLDDEVREILLSDGLLLLLIVLGGGLVLGAMEAFDSWRERRAGEVAWLRGQIVTALQHDRVLKNLPVTPVVHLSLSGRSGATVELRGHLRTHWLRHAVLRVVEQETAKNLAVYHIEDRLVIEPSEEAQAA